MESLKAESSHGSTQLFDLNIEKVLEDWEVCHALREVIANALDEQQLTKSEEIQIFKDKRSVWHIKDFGRGLSYVHLTQNENEEKLQNPNLVLGKFGVGLKDALATFDRKGIKLIIKSKHGDITIQKTSKHSFEQLSTLHAAIGSPSQPEMRGTEFLFEDIKDDDINKAKQLFLKFSGEAILERTEFGEVILKRGNVCRIYVNGLKVAEEENFLFSYNITSLTAAMKKALNRERTNVGRSAYTPRVKSILLACTTLHVGQRLIHDLEQFKTGRMHEELKWVDISTHATRILNSSTDRVVFITSDQLVSSAHLRDAAKREGHQIIVIPDNVANKISGTTDVLGRPMRDLNQYLIEQKESFEFDFVQLEQLSQEEKRIYNFTDKIFMLIGGRPRGLRHVRISNTMRPENDHSPIGICNGADEIIIHRPQLVSLERYAGALLQLTALYSSNSEPLTTEFENQLKIQLGKVTAYALSNDDSDDDIQIIHIAKKRRTGADDSTSHDNV